MAIKGRLRFEILRRDRHTCQYCGAQAPDVKLTIDHVVPQALGGDDEPSNLVAACVDCNAGKASVVPDQTIVSAVDERALEWASAMRCALENRRLEGDVLDAAIWEFDDVWSNYVQGSSDRPIPRDVGWEESVRVWIAAGLEPQDLTRLIPKAMKKPAGQAWRYFCGCAWRVIKDAEREALEIVDDWKAQNEYYAAHPLPPADQRSSEPL